MKIYLKLVLTIFVFLIFSKSSFSNEISDWQNPNVEDSIRKIAFQQLIMENYLYTNTDSSLFYSRKFKEQAKNWEIPSEIALGWQMEGLSHFIGGNFKAANFCLSKALEVMITLGDRGRSVALLSNLSMVAEYQGRLGDAIKYNLYAVDYYRDVDDLNNLTKCLMNLGGNYLELKEFDSAEKYFEKSYESAATLGDTSKMASNLMNIGLVQIERNEKEQAILSFQKALKFKKSHSSLMLISRCEQNIGALYTDLNQLDSAKKYLFSAYRSKKELNDVRGIMKVEISLGDYYIKKGRLDSAKYFIEPLILSENTKDFIDIKVSASNFLHKIYEAEGRYKESLELFKLYQTLSDSITNASEKTEIIKIEYQFNLEKQHLQDSLRYQEIQHEQELTYEGQLQKRNFWLLSLGLGSLFLVILIVVIIIGYRQKQRANTIISIQNEALNQEKRKTELNFLKNQISPHFFFNSLNTIYALSQTDNKMAGEITHKLGKLMRYLVYESDQSEEVTLSEEIDFLTYYIELSEIRMPKTVKVKFKTSVENNSFKIPPLLFINLVENSFKHGVSNSEPCELSFELIQKENKLNFTATNSIPVKQLTKEVGGVGTTNLKRRLDLIYGEGKYDFTLSNEDKQFIARISINLS